MVGGRRRGRRLAAVGGIVGPVVFVAAWAVLGRRAPDYSAVDDAISRLAATGAEDRAAMTAGMVAFGVGVPVYGLALRSALRGPAWAFATASGLATLGVAAFPLGSPSRDATHGVFAGLAYATLAATPLAAAAPLARAGEHHWARWSLAVGVLSAVSLAATVLGPASGLLQRTGLTVADGWIVASSIGIIRRNGATHWPNEGRPSYR